MHKKMEPSHLPLTPQEITCLEYAQAGMTPSDIAITLNLAIRTVNFRLLNAEKKLAHQQSSLFPA